MRAGAICRDSPVPRRMREREARIVIAFSRPHVYELSRGSFDPDSRRSRPPARRRFSSKRISGGGNMSVTETKSAVWSARDWAKALVIYRQPSAARGIIELVVTFPPFVAVWAAMLLASSHGQFWLSFALAPLAAGLLIRLFLIQHDCGHGSFLPSKLANDWVGRAIGVLTMTPYDHWRRCHAIHHATSGNLDRRGIGDIKTLTVREYFARNWRDRLRYRLYRHPLVMFGVGPAYVFLLENRVPIGFMRKGPMPWLSTMTTNAGMLLVAGLLILCVGFTTFLIVHLPVLMLAATM